MDEQEQKPAYFFRKEDFKPFVGFREHARRSALGAIEEEKRTGKYCGPGSDYEIIARGRSIMLGLYNAALVGVPLGAAAAGLARLLFYNG